MSLVEVDLMTSILDEIENIIEKPPGNTITMGLGPAKPVNRRCTEGKTMEKN